MANSPHLLGYSRMGMELTKGEVGWREQSDFGTGFEGERGILLGLWHHNEVLDRSPAYLSSPIFSPTSSTFSFATCGTQPLPIF
ncbi:uncharacterized protein C8R40DRAFT_1175470 [Lentinula edodes]|uniref:uncharacterized protein n=1 Tax=Lentinula edodes TaxID=5353 RepID=UPI001E8E6CF7|nr:uncharacterized protein C8R40DRAFT_1175470 [Lentinula edodes]KAH7870671.1 hypothetical protein C8R40DRAFT_1175470 [Lentinula edodes]